MEQTPKKLYILLIYLALAMVTFIAFEQVRLCEFTFTDDVKFAAENQHVKAGLTRESIAYAFTTTTTANWMPLTWLSVMADSQLFGHSSATYHMMNLFYHVLNVLLLFAVLKKMTGTIWRSAFVAAVFAVHPLRVESVAWVAERKDVLSGVFWILTIAAYLAYAQRPGIRRYLLVVLALVLGLMAKPMLVTLPFVLLLLDYWPLGRFQWPHQNTEEQLSYSQSTYLACKRASLGYLIKEKLPLFILVTASSVVTVIVQQTKGAVGSLDRYTPTIRINNALVSYVRYIGKMIWPTRLAVFYPHLGPNLPIWKPIIALVILVGVSAGVIYLVRRKHDFAPLLVGWLWYIGTLVPVIGLVQVGIQAMADRYTYLPSIGIHIMVAWGVARFCRGLRFRNIILPISAGLLLIGLTLCTRTQVRYWRNSLTLLHHNVDVIRNNYIIHYRYANALVEDGRLNQAAFHYQKSLRINPRYKEPYSRLAKVFYDLDKFDEAIAVCTNRLRIGKPEAAIYHRLGLAYTRKRAGSLAIKSYKKCLQLNPDSASTHKNLAKLVMSLKNPDAAIRHLTEAIRLNPNIALTHFNLALLLKNKGRTEEAITHFREALRIKPNWQKAMNSLAWILATHSQEKFRNSHEAIQLAKRACDFTYYQDPRSIDILAAAYAAAGRFDDAVATAEKAVQLTASGDNKQRHQAIQNRLQLYKQEKPYRQPPYTPKKGME